MFESEQLWKLVPLAGVKAGRGKTPSRSLPRSWMCPRQVSFTRNVAFHGKTISSIPLFSITDIQLEMFSFHIQVKARLFQVSAPQAQASSWQWSGFPFAPGRVLVSKAQLAEQSCIDGLGPQVRKSSSVPACPVLSRHLPLIRRGSGCAFKDDRAASFFFFFFKLLKGKGPACSLCS